MARTTANGNTLPKRFQPLFDQAQTETAIRYGAQESALASILEQVTRDASRQSEAQSTAGQSILGAYKNAGSNLTRAYSDAGLTPQVLQGIANSPTGQRLAGELASGQAGIQQGLLGAQAGQQYLQQHIADQYRDDAGQVAQQLSALGKEKGLYQSSLLDQLITGDRSARHDANVAAAKQAHDDQQAILDRAATMGNALIGQGITPQIDENGNVTLGPPIPGGKADPNAKGNQTLKSATPAVVKAATGTFSQAATLAKTLWEAGTSRRAAAQALLNGRKAVPGEKVYDPQTGKPKLNPDGTQMTTKGKSEVPSFKADQPLLQAALDMAYDGHVSPATIRKLHKAYGNGIVGALGLETNRKAPRPQLPQANPQGVFAAPIAAPKING